MNDDNTVICAQDDNISGGNTSVWTLKFQVIAEKITKSQGYIFCHTLYTIGTDVFTAICQEPIEFAIHL